VAEGRGRLYSEARAGAAVSADRGRLSGETREPLPNYRALYNPHLQPAAGTLRKCMTGAEVCLWKYVLRAGQMKGYTFNRQRPVLRYIADFMCKPLHLIIEVDGSIHDVSRVKNHDTFRQSELEACGFTLLRFTNDQVLHDIDSVRNSILLKINEIETNDTTIGKVRVKYNEEKTEAV
jgi:very-short-patch-repair endonuclease